MGTGGPVGESRAAMVSPTWPPTLAPRLASWHEPKPSVNVCKCERYGVKVNVCVREIWDESQCMYVREIWDESQCVYVREIWGESQCVYVRNMG